MENESNRPSLSEFLGSHDMEIIEGEVVDFGDLDKKKLKEFFGDLDMAELYLRLIINYFGLPIVKDKFGEDHELRQIRTNEIGNEARDTFSEEFGEQVKIALMYTKLSLNSISQIYQILPFISQLVELPDSLVADVEEIINRLPRVEEYKKKASCFADRLKIETVDKKIEFANEVASVCKEFISLFR